MHCKLYIFHILSKRSPNQTGLQLAKRLVSANTWCLQSFSTNTGDKGVKESATAKDMSTSPELPEEPTNCCMSGCANCVWIEYAKELKTIFCCSGEKTQEIILKKIEDPSMKAFLAMELKMMEKD